MKLNNFLNHYTNVCLKNKNDNYKIVSSNALNYKIFKKNGYVVVKNFLNKNDINQIKSSYKKFIINNPKVNLFRQNTGIVEKNSLTNKKYLLNPIQNVQDLQIKKYKPYIDCAKKIILSQKIKKITSFFLKAEPLLIQSMQFEIDPQTPPHYDAYYMNSRFKNGMIGI